MRTFYKVLLAGAGMLTVASAAYAIKKLREETPAERYNSRLGQSIRRGENIYYMFARGRVRH